MYTHPAGMPGPRTTVRSLLVLIAFALLALSSPTRVHAFVGYGGVTTDTTWTGTVVLIGDVVVEPQAILRLAPGTRVVFSVTSNVFNDPAGETGLLNDLIVKGTMKALGSVNDSIYFVSSRPTIVEGDWGGVRFDSSAIDTAGVIDYAVFRGGTHNLNFNRSGATVTHSSFDYSSLAGVSGDSVVADCHIAEIATHTNKQYGVRFTNFYGSLVRSRLSGGRLGEVLLTGGNGRFAENTIANARFARSAGLILSNSLAVVARDSFINDVVGISTQGGAAPQIDSCYFSANDVGLQADVSTPYVAHCQFLGNGVAVDVLQGGVPVISDSLSAACDFVGNAIHVRNVKGNVSFVRCHYNYWGTTNEDSLFARMVFGVDPSPWTDASHTAEIRATSYGVFTTGVTWSGTVFVRGDIVVPAGSGLAILPGTVVKFQSGFATWDTLGINTGLCDIQVFGTLSVSGSISDSTQMVRFTSSSAAPVPGEWGSIYFGPQGGGTVLGAITEYGANGFTVYGSPSISYSTARFHSKHGVYVNGLNSGEASFLRCTLQWNPAGFYLEQGPGFPTLQSCVAEHNQGDGLYAFYIAPRVTNCRFDSNVVGMHLVQAGPEVVGDTLRYNTQYGLLGESISLPGGTLKFGSATQPNLLLGNGLGSIKNATNEDIIQAGLNCFGTDSETEIAASVIGAVNYSPFFTAGCTDTVSATSYGVLRSDATWTGARSLRGDIVVPVGTTLYIAPGATITAWTKRSAYDDGSGITQRPDILVLGRLVIGQPGGAPVVLTSDAASPVAGDWGTVRMLSGGAPADSISRTTFRAWSGGRSDAGSPVFTADSLAAPATGGTTLLASGGVPVLAGLTVGVAPSGVGIVLQNSGAVLSASTLALGAAATGVRVTGGSPVLDGVTVAGGDSALVFGWASGGLVTGGSYTAARCGIRVTAGAPLLQSVVVNAAQTGVLLDTETTARLTGVRVTATAAGVTALDIRGGSAPRVESCVFDNGNLPGAAVGVALTGARTKPDLGGGARGSAGLNVLKGYAPGSQYAVTTDPAVTDTVYALHCFWGVADSTLIPSLVLDRGDNPALPVVAYSPVLSQDVAAHGWSARPERTSATQTTLSIRGEPRAQVRVTVRPLNGDAGAQSADLLLDGAGLGVARFAWAADRAYRYSVARLADGQVFAEGVVEPSRPEAFALTILPGRAGTPRLALRLPADVGCELSLYRLDGRRAGTQFVAAGAGGERHLDLPGGGAIGTGVYWVRAVAGAQRITQRVVVIR